MGPSCCSSLVEEGHACQTIAIYVTLYFKLALSFTFLSILSQELIIKCCLESQPSCTFYKILHQLLKTVSLDFLLGDIHFFVVKLVQLRYGPLVLNSQTGKFLGWV